MERINPLKRGDTFAMYINLTDSSGEEEIPLIVSVENIKCQVRTEYDKLVQTLDVEETETPGKYIIKSDDTQNWPIGDLLSDIQITINNITSSSDTFIIPLVKDVTRDE